LVTTTHYIYVNNYQWVKRVCFANHIRQMFLGTAIADRCEFLNTIHALQLDAREKTNQTIRILLTSPTASAQLYNLASIQTSVSKNYESRLSSSQHFIQIIDCNEDNVSTRQCQLMCQKKYMQTKCTECYPSSLTGHLLGVNVKNDKNLRECTINEYSLCARNHDNSTDKQMKACLAACLPACSYWNYDFTAVESVGRTIGTTLIVPTNDFIEFPQRRAYTWFGVVADIGGLL
jgi:hypothetical protein